MFRHLRLFTLAASQSIMMRPRFKEAGSASDGLSRLIPQALMKRYSDVRFDGYTLCPRCHFDHVVGFGWVKKVFCTIIAEGGFRDVEVYVRRYLCRRCGRTFLADAPFYDGCKYGKPIVDLCLYLSASNSYNRVESILTQCGIQVDRDTVRNYTIRFGAAAKDAEAAAGDDSKMWSKILKILFNVDSLEEIERSLQDTAT